MKVLVGIVTFNPDLLLFKQVLESFPSLNILVVDNASNNQSGIKRIVGNYKLVDAIFNYMNLGIASALNTIFRFAEAKGFDWVLTFDQDSIPPKNMITEYEKCSTLFEDAGILAPIVFDRKTKMLINQSSTPHQINKCITSGSMTKLNLWKQIGGFDERLFIDLVDDDFCFRTNKVGAKIYLIPNVILEHQIGDSSIRHFLWKRIIVRNHSAFRKYYIARNIIYLSKKYNNRILLKDRIHCYLFFWKTILYENDKINKAKSIIKGIKDGEKMD